MKVQICSPKQTVPISTIPVSEKLSGKRECYGFAIQDSGFYQLNKTND